MFYNKIAKIYFQESVEDGMGGWFDTTPVFKGELRVRRAPITDIVELKEYGLVNKVAIKLYTENKVPEDNVFIKFEGDDYRIVGKIVFDVETVLILELM